MKPLNSPLRNAVVCLVVFAILLMPINLTRAQQGKPAVPNLAGFPDPSGVVRTFSLNGDIDLTGPFFQSLVQATGVPAAAARPWRRPFVGMTEVVHPCVRSRSLPPRS